MKTFTFLFNLKDKTGRYISPAMIWWSGILENLGYNVTYYPYENFIFDNFYNYIKQNRPDFLIVGAYDKIHFEFAELKKYTKVIVLQSDDRWRYDSFGKYWIPFIDGVITFEGNLNEYIRDGLPEENFYKMRWAFNPNTMSSIDNKIVYNSKYYISHTGGLHGNRVSVISEFVNRGMDVFINQDANYDVTKNIWNNSKYSLCITNNSINTGKELKGRVVEIPNWCVLLTEPFPDMEQYYDINTELVLFNSVSEAHDRIKWLDKNPTDYEKIKDAGKRRLWNYNTAYHEWNKILPLIDSDYKSINIINLLKYKHGEYYYE